MAYLWRPYTGDEFLQADNELFGGCGLVLDEVCEPNLEAIANDLVVALKTCQRLSNILDRHPRLERNFALRDFQEAEVVCVWAREQIHIEELLTYR